MSNDDFLTRERTEQLAYRLWREAGCPEARDIEFWLRARDQIATAEARQDRASVESFPASDAPSAPEILGVRRAELLASEAPPRVAPAKAPPPRDAPPPVVPARDAPPRVAPARQPPPSVAVPPPIPLAAPLAAPGWRAEARRRFQAWWEYPANRDRR